MRSKGTANYSGNFEVKFVEPIDARSRVQYKADLTSSTAWTSSDGSIYVYDGMVVSVYADSIPDNNGVYRLKSAAGYANISSWEKVGSGSGHTIQDSTGTPVAQRTNLRFNNIAITDSSVTDTTIITGITGPAGADGIDGQDGQSFVPDKRGLFTDAEVVIGEATGTVDDYYFILVDPDGDDRTDPLTVAPSLVGDMSGHMVAYNGTTWIDYGQLVGVKGDTGDTGPAGSDGAAGAKGDTGLTGLNYLGDYIESSTYAFRDAVRMTGVGADAGNVYYCNVLEITEADNKIPGVSNDWKLLVEKGQQGDQGPQGEPGNDGADGVGELIMPPFYIYLPANKSFGRYVGTGSQYAITAIPAEGWTTSEFLRHVAFESSNPTVAVTNNTPALIYNQTANVAVSLSITYGITTPGATLSSSKIEFSRNGSTWTDKGSLAFVGNTATYTESVVVSSDNTSNIIYRITVTDSNSMTAQTTTVKSFPGFVQPVAAFTPLSEVGYDYGNITKTIGTLAFNRSTQNTSMVNYGVYVELNGSGTKTQYGSNITITNTPTVATSFSTQAISIDSTGNIIIGSNTYAVAGIKTSSSCKIWIRIESDIIGPSNTTVDILSFTRSFSYKIYYGSSTSATLPVADADLRTMITSFTPIESSIAARNYAFGALAASYKWICIQNSLATPTIYNDSITGFGVAMNSPVTRSYDNGFGNANQYKFIRTYGATSSPLTITAS